MKNSFVFKSNQLGSKVPPLGNFSPFAFYLGREAMCPPPKKKNKHETSCTWNLLIRLKILSTFPFFYMTSR